MHEKHELWKIHIFRWLFAIIFSDISPAHSVFCLRACLNQVTRQPHLNINNIHESAGGSKQDKLWFQMVLVWKPGGKSSSSLSHSWQSLPLFEMYFLRLLSLIFYKCRVLGVCVCNRSLYASKRKLWIIVEFEMKHIGIKLKMTLFFFIHSTLDLIAVVAPFFLLSLEVYAIVSPCRTHIIFPSF